MHIEHVDPVAAGERGEADRRAGQRGYQRQMAAEPLAEGGLVIGGGGPGLLLRLAVVIGGQLLDAGAEDFAQQRGVDREIRPQRQLGVRLRHHRAISQVVPSLESFNTTPMAASSSRIRSASVKFFALRAAMRASIRITILLSSIVSEAGRNAAQAAAGMCNRPINCALAFRHAAAGLAPLTASPRNSCSAAKRSRAVSYTHLTLPTIL